jgi:hypothetical protein
MEGIVARSSERPVVPMGESGRGVEPVTQPDDPMDDFKLRIDLHITADTAKDLPPGHPPRSPRGRAVESITVVTATAIPVAALLVGVGPEPAQLR